MNGNHGFAGMTKPSVVDTDSQITPERLMAEPICCVTGQIAGHPDACHDCDPCLASGSVSEPVKRLIKEVTEWRDKYADAAVQLDEAQRRIRSAWKQKVRDVAQEK